MKIALFHNLPAGGAKRALFEHALGLKRRGHVLDAYVMSTANEDYLPLAPLCREIHRYEMPPISFSPTASRLLFHPIMVPFWNLVGLRVRDVIASCEDVRSQTKRLGALEVVYAGMARDIDARGYDLVYVHHCDVLLSPYLLRCLSTPAVYYCQDTLRHVYEWAQPGYGDPDFDRSTERLLVRKRLGNLVSAQHGWLMHQQERRNVDNARAANLVLANSWYSREAILRAYGINARVCYLGVDSEFFCPDPAVARRDVVLSVGSFLPNKCHEFTVDAVATIPRSRRPQMRLIGYETTTFGKKELGPLAKSLLRRAEERGVDLVITKEATDEVLRDAYRQARVVAFAPHLEPFGFIALEAAACGTPVVAVSEGGPRETVQDGVTGFLTDRDAYQFGAALDRILARPGLAAELGRNGREAAVTRWTWARSVDRLEQLFEDTLRHTGIGDVRVNAPASPDPGAAVASPGVGRPVAGRGT